MEQIDVYNCIALLKDLVFCIFIVFFLNNAVVYIYVTDRIKYVATIVSFFVF